MNVKQQIIEKVNAINDPNVLNEILSLVTTETEKIYQFNTAERENVLEGLADADVGRTYSQVDSEILISKWLKEKSSGL